MASSNSVMHFNFQSRLVIVLMILVCLEYHRVRFYWYIVARYMVKSISDAAATVSNMPVCC